MAAAEPVSAGLGFTWNPDAVGLPGAAFSGDALKGHEWSLIDFDDVTHVDWTEHGFFRVERILANGTDVTPTELNNDYTLYFEFNLAGDVITNSISTMTMSFYGLAGTPTFGHDGSNQPFVDTGAGTPVLLGLSQLISGNIGNETNGDLFAELLVDFTPEAAALAFFEAPAEPYWIDGDFYHAVAAGGVTLLPNGDVKIDGGDDTLTLVSVPVPATPLLLACGLVLMRYRRQGRRG
jgi:hypothetical protein